MKGRLAQFRSGSEWNLDGRGRGRSVLTQDQEGHRQLLLGSMAGGKAQPAAAAPQPQGRRCRQACRFALAAIPLALALLVYNTPFIMEEYSAWYGYGEAPAYELPPGVMDAFRQYDQDGDGYLDPYEFAPLGLMVREEVSV